MDQSMLETMLKMLSSSSEADAMMALNGIKGAFEAEGVTLPQALAYAAKNIPAIKQSGAPAIVTQAASQAPVSKMAGAAVAAVSGMPQCHVPKPGFLELIPPGKPAGELIALQGAASAQADVIAAGFKDALSAAIINKSKMKLKLVDVKDKRGEVIETVLQAEYERAGMIPVRIWGNVRGEAAALAAVLRKAVAANMPELVAA
jgi:hypothetical protein